MIYLDLLIGFLRVGLFSFGGAYGAIPLIRDVVLSYDWLTDEELTYMIAVAESTPGPIMVNLATYVGSSQAGFLGAVMATTAVVFPAFVIIFLVMIAMKNMLKNKYMQAILGGVKPCVIGMIVATGVFMIIKNAIQLTGNLKPEVEPILLTVILGVTMLASKPLLGKKISPIMLIVVSALLGILVYGL